MVKIRRDMQIPLSTYIAHHEQPRAVRKLCREINAFANRAENSATSLYAISYYCCSLFGSGALQRDIACRLIGVAGALTFLSSFIDDDQYASPLLSLRDMEIVSANVSACDEIVVKVTATMKILEEYLKSDSHGSIPAKFNAFNKGEEVEPLRMLTHCCGVVIKATMIARREVLSRRRARNDDEELELEHFQHPRLQTVLSYLGFFPGATKLSETAMSGPSIEVGVQPKADPFLPLPTSLPLPYHDKSIFETKTQFACCNFVHASDAMRGTKGQDDNTNDTPNSTPENTPVAEFVQEEVSTDDTDQASSTTIERQDGRNTTGGTSDMDDITARLSNISLLANQELETYILQPHTLMSKFGFTLTLGAEPLYLDKESILAHMKKADTTMDAIKKLHPDQLWLINAHTNTRSGCLASVQLTDTLNVNTPMGVLSMRPVMFVIKAPKENREETHADRPASQPLSLDFWHEAIRRQTDKATRAQEISYFVEHDGYQSDALQAYQSITVLPPYQDQSFEELRLSDYASGAGDGYGRGFPLPGSIRGSFGAQSTSKSTARELQDAIAPVRVGAFEKPETLKDTFSSRSPFGCLEPTSEAQDRWQPPVSGSHAGQSIIGSGGLSGMNTSTTQSGPFSSLPSAHPVPTPLKLIGSKAVPQNNGGPPFGGNLDTKTSMFGHPAVPTTPGGLFEGLRFRHPLFETQATANINGRLFGAAPKPTSGGLFGQPRNDPPLGTQKTAVGSLFGPADLPAKTSLFGGASSASTDLFNNVATTPSSGSGSTYQHPSGPFGPRSSLFAGFGWASKLSNSLDQDQDSMANKTCGEQPSGLSGSHETGGHPRPSHDVFPKTSNSPKHSLFGDLATTPANLEIPSTLAEGLNNTTVPELICQKCETRLVFHRSAEQAARMCGTCNGNNDTNCWMCRPKVQDATGVTFGAV